MSPVSTQRQQADIQFPSWQWIFDITSWTGKLDPGWKGPLNTKIRLNKKERMVVLTEKLPVAGRKHHNNIGTIVDSTVLQIHCSTFSSLSLVSEVVLLFSHEPGNGWVVRPADYVFWNYTLSLSHSCMYSIVTYCFNGNCIIVLLTHIS